VVTATPPARPLYYRGRPVPWITKWSGEHLPVGSMRLLVHVSGRLGYEDEHHAERDSRGVLWFRDGNAPGEGQPLWSLVHTGRQRRAMRLLRCQICDTPLDRQRTPWLFSDIEWPHLARRPWTNTPPTCENCWPTAEQQCPHLRRHQPVVRCYVIACAPFGIQGDLYTREGGQADLRAVAVRYDSPRIPGMLAKQALVTIPTAQPA